MILTRNSLAGFARKLTKAVPGRSYQVEYTTDITQGNWTVLANGITATNNTVTASDNAEPGWRRFYRVAERP